MLSLNGVARGYSSVQRGKEVAAAQRWLIENASRKYELT